MDQGVEIVDVFLQSKRKALRRVPLHSPLFVVAHVAKMTNSHSKYVYGKTPNTQRA